MSKDPAAVKLGRKGGKATSPAKKAASRLNVAKAREVKAQKHDESEDDGCPYCAIRGCDGDCRNDEN